MLSAAQFDKLSVPITDLYRKYEQSVIEDMARRISSMDMLSSTTAWQMQRLIESGAVYENAIEQLSAISGLSDEELKKAFAQAGVEAIKFDDSIYKEAGLNPLPLNLSPSMLDTLNAGIRKAGNKIYNLTKTTAIDSQNSFLQAADLAYMQVSSGAFSYDEAVRRAVISLSDNGVNTIDYATGHKDRVDVAARRAVITGVSQTTSTMQLDRAAEMEQDLVQVSAHAGARPSHQEWQGHIFSISGKSKKYRKLSDATGLGTVEGLMGANCRHSYYPFFDGISENAYKAKELEELNDKTVSYNGADVPLYEATQEQRKLERGVRKIKRRIGALDAAGKSSEEQKVKLQGYQAKLRSFTKETGLRRQSARERVYIPGPQAVQPVQAEPANVPLIPLRKRKLTREEFLAKAKALDETFAKKEAPKSKLKELLDSIPEDATAEDVIRAFEAKERNRPSPLERRPVQAPIAARRSSGVAPVSKALDTRTVRGEKTTEQVSTALGSIDKVHTDGALPKISIDMGGQQEGSVGSFFHSGNRAVNINLAKGNNHQALTLVHEIGHFIDHSGMDAQWSSERGEANKTVIKAIRESNWFTGFRDRLESANTRYKSRNGFSIQVDADYASYLTSSRELFARAYAQYIAKKSGNSILLSQLKDYQDDGIRFSTQWENDDFDGIEKAFDDLFKAKGWIK